MQQATPLLTYITFTLTDNLILHFNQMRANK